MGLPVLSGQLEVLGHLALERNWQGLEQVVSSKGSVLPGKKNKVPLTKKL